MQSLPSVLVPLPSANCRNVGKIHVEKIGGVKHKIKTLKSISNPNSRLFYLFFFWKVDCFGEIFTFSKIFIVTFSLIYTPCQDCSGAEYINITMYEEQSDPDIPPANTTDVITVKIEPVNDPPIIFLFHNGQPILHDDPTEPITVCHTPWQY